MVVFAIAGFFPFGLRAASASGQEPLLFLADKDYPPMAYLDDGVAKGMDVDLARALAKSIQREVQIELMDWNLAQEKVLNGEADALLGMSITDERRKVYDFARSMFTREFSLVVRNNDVTIRGVGDLKGKRLGVTAGGFPRRYMQSRTGVHLVLIENYEDGLNHLTAGTIDAVAADLWVVAYYIEKGGTRDVTIVGKPFTTAPSAIAVKKGNIALLNEVNRALDALHAAGTTAEIRDHWRPQEILFISRARARFVVTLTAGVFMVILVGAMGMWVITLKKQIRIRRKTESALRESEEQFHRVFEHSETGMMIVELDGRFRMANHAFCRMLGYSVDELTTLRFTDITHQEDREMCLAEIQMLVAGTKNPLQLEKRYVRKDGSILWALVIGSAIRDSQGKPLFMVGQVQDITERKRSEGALRRSREQLRALTSRLQTLREDERTHISREIHDQLGQLLTALKLDLHSVKRMIPGIQEVDKRDGLVRKTDSAIGLADEAISSVQKIATELRPIVLDRLGLAPAIEGEAQSFQSRTGIPCECVLPLDLFAVPTEHSTAVFRIFQELLTNVTRHAKASQVEVRLDADGKDLVLEVSDDGVGIRESDLVKPTSLGVLGMQERAGILGGSVTFARNADKGTTVTVRMPLTKSTGQSP